MRLVASAALVVGAATLLTGCVGATADPPLTASGPWASEFADAYEQAESDFERSVLADGVVTEAEYAEVMTRYSDCLAARGVTLYPRPDGSGRFTFNESLGPDAANAADEVCRVESGEASAGRLYQWTRRNPENRDEGELIVECLRAAGVVGAEYTAEDYRRDESTFTWAALEADDPRLPDVTRCRADPLGILG